MDNPISILIADDNIEFGDLLKEYLSQESDMKVVGVARDGIQAVEMIKKLTPQIVILDIIMPNLDGIGVLEALEKTTLNIKPQILILTAIGQDLFIQKAMRLGAEYYILKPFNLEDLVYRLREIYSGRKNEIISRKSVTGLVKGNNITPSESVNSSASIEIEVTRMMHEAGISVHMSGYQYIREAVIFVVNNPNVFGSFSKILYPSIASKFNTTDKRVERAIRNAIESAWAKRDRHDMDKLPVFLNIHLNKQKKSKPTNSEFIAMMADELRLSMKYNKDKKP